MTFPEPIDAECTSCSARILWAITVNKRPIPLDLPPRADGNIRLTGATVTAYNKRRGPECEVITNGSLFDDDGPRYYPHHATCPNADQWRGKT